MTTTTDIQVPHIKLAGAVTHFEKVSLEQFTHDLFASDTPFHMGENLAYAEKVWRSIQLPKRATNGSAGYDFFLPDFGMPILVQGDKPVLIPTGIRCQMCDYQLLMLLPRSGLGFKYGFRLENTAGIIDSDYYGAANEGHIQAKLSATQPLTLRGGDRFMQGIFLPYFITRDDQTELERSGGFGSTGQ